MRTVAIIALVACSSNGRATVPEDPTSEVLMRNAAGFAISTHPIGERCQDCLDDNVVKFEPINVEYQKTGRANLDRAIAALDAHQLRLAMRYFEFLFSRFTEEPGVVDDATREVEKRDAAIDAFEVDCLARCRQCSSSCRAIDDTCLRFCIVELPGHTPTRPLPTTLDQRARPITMY